MESFIPIILGFAGLVGGFVGSEVGAGALITVPVLLFLGLSPAAAVATSALSAWLINAVASFDYWRSGVIQKQLVWRLAPFALVGAVIGAQLIVSIDERTASGIVAVLFAFVFLVLFAVARTKGAGLRAGSMAFDAGRKALAAAFAFGLGVYGGFFTVGVTTLFVIMFVYVLRRNFVQAAADSVFVSTIFLAGSLITFIIDGIIEWQFAVPLALGSVIGAHIGTRTALRYGSGWLRGLVALVVVTVVVQLATKSLGGAQVLACEHLELWCK